MKIFILVALFAALATAVPSPDVPAPVPEEPIDSTEQDVRRPETANLGVALKSFYEAFRRIMPCGDQKNHIPVLAPFVMEHLPLNYSNKNVRLIGNISELNILGLNNYRFLKLNFDEKTNRLTSDIVISEMQLLGEYELDLWADLFGFPTTFKGAGLLDYKIVDLRIIGSAEFKQNGKGLAISDMKHYFSLGDFVANNWNSYWDISLNNYMNQFARKHVLMLTQQMQGKINDLLEKYYVPYVNEMLQNVPMKDAIKYLNEATKKYKGIKCDPEL